MTKLFELTLLGQSVWLDYIQRDFINSGELQNRIELGVRGMTSNPTIFEKAIQGSELYDNDFRESGSRRGRTQSKYSNPWQLMISARRPISCARFMNPAKWRMDMSAWKSTHCWQTTRERR